MAKRIILSVLALALISAAPAERTRQQLETIVAEEAWRAGASQSWHRLYSRQIERESSFDPNAVSRSGAQGLTQFMPATMTYIYPKTKPSCAGVSPFDPACSVRAQIIYLRMLAKWTGPWDTETDLMAASLAAYHGGAGWVLREKRLCASDASCRPSRWFGHVAEQCSRPQCAANRAYVETILRNAGISNSLKSKEGER